LGTLRTPSATLMATNVQAASTTVISGAIVPKPNHIAAISAHTSDGIARPTTTKSWPNQSAFLDRPISSPIGRPIANAISRPRLSRPRLVPNAS
jgi:hypothetical protein